jgi:hypothetical protein
MRGAATNGLTPRATLAMTQRSRWMCLPALGRHHHHDHDQRISGPLDGAGRV